MTFTSAYVSRSLGHSLDLIGKTFEQLESVTSAEEKRLINYSISNIT